MKILLIILSITMLLMVAAVITLSVFYAKTNGNLKAACGIDLNKEMVYCGGTREEMNFDDKCEWLPNRVKIPERELMLPNRVRIPERELMLPNRVKIPEKPETVDDIPIDDDFVPQTFE